MTELQPTPIKTTSFFVDTPTVSIILIVRNGAETIRLALTSLIAQSFPDWECIIVDDASTDSTSAILSGLSDPRFVIERSPVPLGRGKARRLALSMARGSYVATLDADDFYFPKKLANQVAILNAEPALIAVVAGLYCFDDNLRSLGVPVGYFRPGRRRIPSAASHLRIPFGGIMFRWNPKGGLTYEDLPRGEDMHFFSELLAGQQIYIEAEATYGCRWKMNFHDVILGLQQGIQTYQTKATRDPLRSSLLVIYCKIKIQVYRWLWRRNLWYKATRFRYRTAPDNLNYEYRRIVSALTEEAKILANDENHDIFSCEKETGEEPCPTPKKTDA